MNYLVNTDKQYVYTMNEEHMSEIQRTLPDHTISTYEEIGGSVFPVFLWGVTTTSYRSYKKTRELDKLVVKDHDDFYDLSRIPDQQDKATLLSTIRNDFFRLVQVFL